VFQLPFRGAMRHCSRISGPPALPITLQTTTMTG
jgi:hypothetical protein